MAKAKVCGIYCIENLINGKKYIGQSIDIYSRWTNHKNELNRGAHINEKLQNGWNKYGPNNFKFYILRQVDIDDLDLFEKYYIELYDSYVNGYNKDFGGSSRRFFTEEAKEKMRKNHKSRPIYQIDLDGNIVNRWSGASEASKKLGIGQANIHKCLVHKRWIYYDYIWLFVDEYDDFDLNEYKKREVRTKKIVQMALNGELIKIWDGAYQTEEFGFNPSCITLCCQHKRKSHKGYLWSYYGEEASQLLI